MTQQPYGPKHAKMVADAKAVKARMYAAAYVAPKSLAETPIFKIEPIAEPKRAFRKFEDQNMPHPDWFAKQKNRHPYASTRLSNGRLAHHTRVSIIRRVARWTGNSALEITGRRKGKDIIPIRFLAVGLCRRYTGMSFPEIGMAFDRDHTTVLYAFDRYKELKAERNARCRAHTEARG